MTTKAEQIVSKSKRTTISVELDSETGVGSISVDRDGQRVHRIDLMKEPVQKAGLGT